MKKLLSTIALALLVGISTIGISNVSYAEDAPAATAAPAADATPAAAPAPDAAPAAAPAEEKK